MLYDSILNRILCIFIFILILFTSNIKAKVFNVNGKYATGESCDAVVAGDFNGDSYMDMAMSQRLVDSIYIHLNDGNGDFSEIITFEAARDGGLATADFNNDGYFDLLLYDAGWLFDTWGTTVYMNNGDGTFSLSFQDSIGSPRFAAGDFNNDNKYDIAVYDPVIATRGIWFFIGKGDGTFEQSVMVESSAVGDFVTGDVDNDGDIDLLFKTASDAFCRLNNGDGTFSEPFSTLSGASLGVLTELNGDQFPDLLRKQTYGCSGHAVCLYGNGDGTFQPPHSAWITSGLLSGIELKAADFTNDGFPDIALYAQEYGYVEVGFNDGRQNYKSFKEHVPVGSGGKFITAADFDNDGDIDLASIGNNDTLVIAFSLGAQHDRTIIVPDDAPSIQAAVTMAWNLDTILVCPGTYYGSIDFDAKNLVLMSYDCSGKNKMENEFNSMSMALTTILDGNGTGRVFTFDNGEDDRSVVSGFTIQNGNASGYGGAIYCYDIASPTIINNIIKNNYASSAGGGIFVNTGDACIKNNIIYNNISGFIGGGIYIGGSNGKYINNTVYGNSTVDGGGGLFVNYGLPTICNNIFWGNSSTNKSNEIEWTAYVTNVTYCDVQGGWSGEGNFDLDPMFVDPANGNFSLLPESPCINAGDPALPTDPDGSVSDLGAVYYPTSTGIDISIDNQLPQNFGINQNYPNPFNPTTIISYEIPTKSFVELTIYNINGQKIITLVNSNKAAGRHEIEWNGCDENGNKLATGIYLYKIQAGDYVNTKKMLLLK